jgi:hypothetical protein
MRKDAEMSRRVVPATNILHLGLNKAKSRFILLRREGGTAERSVNRFHD